MFLSDEFSPEDARAITGGLDFSGEPVEDARDAHDDPSEEVVYTRSLATEDGAAQLVAHALEENESL